VTPIRPSALPPASTQAPLSGPAQDAAKLAAQKAFFALVSGQAQPAAASASAPAAAPQTAAPVIRTAAALSDAPQKILRPGSLLDIRV
jgi:hypothetical protein